MLITEATVADLITVSGNAFLYLLVTVALFYLRMTKHINTVLYIISFALFTLAKIAYICYLLIELDKFYYSTLYQFAMAFVAMAALQYNQKINITFLGCVFALAFTMVINFVSSAYVESLFYSYVVLLHVIIIASFMKSKDKNLGDLFVLLGLSSVCIWVVIRWQLPLFLFEKSLYIQFITGVVKHIGAFGFTIGLLLKIILEHKKQLRALTLKDDLSNLSNRRALQSCIDSLISKGIAFQLALIRIKGIRQINEHYGHQVGDETLACVCTKLQAQLINSDLNNKGRDSLARLGGNYLVFIHRSGDEKQPIDSFITAAINEINIKNIHFHVGLADFPRHGKKFVEVLTAAEIVLSEYNSVTTNIVEKVDAGKLQEYRIQQDMATALTAAIQNEEIEVYYQPKYTLDNFSREDKAKLTSAEALARWSYKGKSVPPRLFIKLAEDYDLIADLDALVMKKAWLKASELESQGQGITIAVNYSSSSLSKSDGLNQMVLQIKERYQLNAELLEIEITESAMAQCPFAQGQLHKLRQLGFKIAIDDFGTGYSNLSQLQALPIDILKIDKVFVDLIESKPHVTELIIEMAHKLKLEIVAEGVEHLSQLTWLAARGCQHIQGYLLSKPLSEDDFCALLSRGDLFYWVK